MDIWERIRYARDKALEAEETERQRLAEADTKEVQQAASVRLATRQSVREALDDVLGEASEPKKGSSTSSAGGVGETGDGGGAAEAGGESTNGEAPAHVAGGGEATAGDGSGAAASGLDDDPLGDVDEAPGTQISG
jgi:membrane protein involved in colicin uptake